MYAGPRDNIDGVLAAGARGQHGSEHGRAGHQQRGRKGSPAAECDTKKETGQR